MFRKKEYHVICGINLPLGLLFIILVQEDVEETKPVVNIKTADSPVVRKAENNGRYSNIYWITICKIYLFSI